MCAALTLEIGKSSSTNSNDGVVVKCLYLYALRFFNSNQTHTICEMSACNGWKRCRASALKFTSVTGRTPSARNRSQESNSVRRLSDQIDHYTICLLALTPDDHVHKSRARTRVFSYSDGTVCVTAHVDRRTYESIIYAYMWCPGLRIIVRFVCRCRRTHD